MAKKNSKALGLILGLTGATALSAAGFGALRLWQWSKDPYSTELWFGFMPGGRGIRIVKGAEPKTYRVQTGYRWHNDEAEEEAEKPGEPEIEIPLPEDLNEAPVQDEACDCAKTEAPGSEAPAVE